MVYTVTLNASLDYIISVDDFRWGYTNRTAAEQILPGGKGINVSIVLHALGVENIALGFIAGFIGEEIKRMVEQSGCRQDFITLPDGLSRINIKMKFRDGTEINGQGPRISLAALEQLMEQLKQLVRSWRSPTQR